MARYHNQAAGSSGACGKRILVIEDEPLLALEWARTLADDGYLVIGPAANVADVKRLIGKAHIDGALLDAKVIAEPVDEIALMLVGQNVPFAVLTAYAGERVPAAYLGAPTLAKPFSEEDLLTTVECLLDRPAVASAA
jgi:DNA-binding response OmpR family regulator